MKRVFGLLLLVTMCFGMFAMPSAAYDGTEAQKKAEALKELSLFQGSEKGFELERTPTRMEALIMLIRMMGKEWEAMIEKKAHPFTDGPAWEDADYYLGYAYENGLTTGVSQTQFDPNGKATAQMYLTFMLRALGYQDQASGTIWSDWKNLSQQAGLLSAGADLASFRRGDAVIVSYAALDAIMQGKTITLAESLQKERIVSEVALATARAIAGKQIDLESPLETMLGAVYAGLGDSISTNRLAAEEITKENVKFYLGIENLDFEEGIASEPMMTSVAHSVCLVKLKAGADVEAVKKEIAAKVNPYKWICAGVEPENVRVESVGNLVLLVMDNHNADRLVANFRALKAANGLTRVGKIYVEHTGAADSRSIARFAEKLTSIKTQYLKNNKVYYATIPDKTYYAQKELGTFLDHDGISNALDQQLKGWNRIELSQLLRLEDYYATDPHWRQEKLMPVAQKLGDAMGITVNASYTSQEQQGFLGAYRRKNSDLPTETIRWLSNAAIENTVVKDYQHPKASAVYQKEALATQTPYDLFLSGATPLTVLENPKASTQKELILFRDSFGSSLAPLLLDSYAKITLVDLRYMVSDLLPEYIDFGTADVLFLYSDQLVNNSLLLK